MFDQSCLIFSSTRINHLGFSDKIFVDATNGEIPSPNLAIQLLFLTRFCPPKIPLSHPFFSIGPAFYPDLP